MQGRAAVGDHAKHAGRCVPRRLAERRRARGSTATERWFIDPGLRGSIRDMSITTSTCRADSRSTTSTALAAERLLASTTTTDDRPGGPPRIRRRCRARDGDRAAADDGDGAGRSNTAGRAAQRCSRGSAGLRRLMIYITRTGRFDDEHAGKGTIEDPSGSHTWPTTSSGAALASPTASTSGVNTRGRCRQLRVGARLREALGMSA